MPSYVITTGVVLRVRPWREHDRLYTLFTESEGKVDVIVAGASKVSSKLAPHLQPFSQVEFMLARGKQLDRLAGAKIIHVFIRPPYALPQASVCASTLEFINLLTRDGQTEPKVLKLLYATWDELGQVAWGGESWRAEARPILGRFVAQLLKQVGLSVPLTQCEGCGEALTTPAVFCWQRHAFFHELHAPVDGKNVGVQAETIAWLQESAAESARMPASALAFLTDFTEGQAGRGIYTLQVLRSIL